MNKTAEMRKQAIQLIKSINENYGNVHWRKSDLAYDLVRCRWNFQNLMDEITKIDVYEHLNRKFGAEVEVLNLSDLDSLMLSLGEESEYTRVYEDDDRLRPLVELSQRYCKEEQLEY